MFDPCLQQKPFPDPNLVGPLISSSPHLLDMIHGFTPG